MLVVLIALSLLLPACSSKKRGDDTDASVDGGDTDSYVIVAYGSEPILLDPGLRWGLRAASSGTHIAAGWSEGTATGYYAMGLAALPLDHPAAVAVATADPGTACDMGAFNIVQPHSTGAGFVYFTLGDLECDALLSWWSDDCELIDDLHPHDGLYDRPVAAFLEAPVDAQARLVVGALSTSEGADEPGDEAIRFLIDRFGPGGAHERLLDEAFDWSDHFAATGEIVRAPGLVGATFVEAGSLTVVAVSERGVLVLARGTLDGEVTVPPKSVLDLNTLHTPPAQHWQYRSAELARAGDRFLAVVHQHYIGPSSAFGDERYSAVLALDGELIDGPHPLDGLAFEPEETIWSGVGLDWSGEVYGHCYYDDSEGFRFVALDGGGLSALEPLLLMSYDYTHSNPFCDVVAVDSDTFAVLMSLNGAADGFQPGLYLMFVDLSEAE